MKSLILLALLTLVICMDSFAYHFVIRGELEGVRYGKVFLKTVEEESKVLFSANIEKGKFILEGNLPEAGRYILQVNRKISFLFLDGEEMWLKTPYTKFDNSKIKGSLANDLELEYNSMVEKEYQNPFVEMSLEYRKILESGNQKAADDKMSEMLQMDELRYDLTKEFIKKHPDNVFSAYIANVVKRESFEKGAELYALLSPQMKKSSYGILLKREIDGLAISAQGMKCPDFQAIDERGKVVSLNSLKGNVIVLDFWASWCGPCRQEMQSLKLQYAEFAEHGVCFMSISLDDSKEKWLKACEEEQIPWISLHDEKGWKKSEIRDLFGIQAIPFIVLVDEEGNIVAKNLRRNHLRDKIREIIKK